NPVFNAWAQSTTAEPVLPYSPEGEIPHAIGVYITKRGQDKIFNGIPAIMEKNGLSISQAYFHKQHFEMEEKSLEDMLPPEGAFRDAALRIKETLQRFLMGLEFNDHKFAVDIEGIDVNIDWADVHIEMDENSKRAGRLDLKLVLETNSIEINVAKFRAQDLGNDFLGAVGLDDFSLFQEPSSEPLRFELPVILENSHGSSGPKLKVGALKSN